MTSSDRTQLPPDAIAAAARRVRANIVGEPIGRPRVAVVGAKFNGAITARLLDGLLSAFEDRSVAREAVTLAWVPGAFELPLVAMRFASSGEVDVVVALGAVIRGDTPHFDFVAAECAAGCRRVSLSTGVPVIFGVLTTDDVDQALERSEPDTENRGYQAALTALEMCDLLTKLPGLPVSVV